MNLTKIVVGSGLALAALAAAAEPVGRVILKSGAAFAVREGREIPLTFGSPIEAKDVLRTGPKSSLQVSFSDDSIKSIRENSELAVEEFRFAGSEDGNERAVFRLLKGGFRAVTGLVGRTNNKNYSVRTPTATVGIRGTDYVVRDCRGDCGADVKDGLYGSVLGMSHGTNQVTLTNNAGEFSMGVNQHFHVADANSAPQSLLQPPSFISAKPEGQAQATQQGGVGSGLETTTASTGVVAESRPSLVFGTETPQVFYNQYPTPESAATTTSPTTTTAAPVTSLTAAPVTTNISEALPTSGSGTAAPGFSSGTVSGFYVAEALAVPHAPNTSFSNHGAFLENFLDSVTFSSTGYSGYTLGGGFVDRNLATSTEVQSVPGVIEWGRWIGGPTAAGGFGNNLTFGTNQGWHYVVGMPATSMPTSGTATFSLLGATTPTLSDNVGGGLGTGQVTSATATANFLSGSLTANMGLTFNGSSGASNYSLASTGSFSPGTPDVFGSGSLTFGSGAVNVCPSSCSASVNGFFAGTGATHLGLVYDVVTTAASPFVINGAVVMRR